MDIPLLFSRTWPISPVMRSMRHRVSVWECRGAANMWTSVPIQQIASAIELHHCIHEVGPLLPGRFLKYWGAPVYRIWKDDGKTVAFGVVFAARRSAEAMVPRLQHRGEKTLHIRAEELTDPDHSRLTQKPCDACPLQCLWPGCKTIKGSLYDFYWHLISDHSMSHWLHTVERCWDRLPPELWHMISEKLQPTSIVEVARLLPIANLSKSHNLCIYLQQQITQFQKKVDVLYCDILKQNATAANIAKLRMYCADPEIQDGRPVTKRSFVKGILSHFGHPDDLLAYLYKHMPVEFVTVEMKHHNMVINCGLVYTAIWTVDYLPVQARSSLRPSADEYRFEVSGLFNLFDQAKRKEREQALNEIRIMKRFWQLVTHYFGNQSNCARHPCSRNDILY